MGFGAKHHRSHTRTKFGIVSTAGASPRPTEVMLKHIEPVRAWGGGLILRDSSEEVKATGRPQVRTANRIRRTAESKIGNRMPLFPFLKVLGFLRTFSKVLKWGLGQSPIVPTPERNTASFRREEQAPPLPRNSILARAIKNGRRNASPTVDKI